MACRPPAALSRYRARYALCALWASQGVALCVMAKGPELARVALCVMRYG